MDERNKKLLIVEDDPAQLRLMAEMLSDWEGGILTAANGKEALRIIVTEGPRIVVTDLMMPEMDGLELCRTLRQHEGVRFVYVVVVTGSAGKESVVDAFEAGADDFIVKPLRKAELLARLRAADRIVSLESDLAKGTREVHRVNAEMALAHRKLNQANEQLQRMATTDELTGLLNRREAMNRLNELWASHDRYGQSFSCIMLDIDHFKLFNDTHGHAAGDQVLKTTADLLAGNTRKTDKVCRIGGEEFLVLCPNVGIDGVAVCAEHLRAAVEQHSFEYRKSSLQVTVSLGAAERTAGMVKPDDLLKAADDALYRSKAEGRNRVTVVEGSAVVTVCQ